MNYGLRAGADGDEAFCRELCDAAGRAADGRARRAAAARATSRRAAREARYARPSGCAERRDYAAGHTATDQAETVLYRLAVSPGRRALLGMAPRRGRLVRPLLG